MTMSMHWITWDWRLKTGTLGMIDFLEDHTTANILDKLMDMRPEFGVYTKNSEGRTPLWSDPVRLHKLLYFTLESRLDKPMLNSDCGSDVLAGVKRGVLALESFCLPLLEHSCSHHFEGAYYR